VAASVNIDIVYTLSYIAQMNVLWDRKKNRNLIAQRGISFNLVSDLIVEGKYVNILENPSREGQFIFLVPVKGYLHVVPFVLDENENIVLKTVYKSRKFQKLYGAKSREKDA